MKKFSKEDIKKMKEKEYYIDGCVEYVLNCSSIHIDVCEFIDNIGKMFNPEQYELTIDERRLLLNRLTKAFHTCLEVFV